MTNNSIAGGPTSAAGRGVATTPHPADSLVVRSLTGLHRLAQLYTEYHAADNEVNYTVFHSAVEPTIPFPDYALRLNRHLDAGDDAMLLSLVLIGRYSQHTGMLPSVLTVHRLFLAALRVVTKTLHDITRTTPSYARAGGIHLSELCRLERHLLVGVGFGVFFKHSDLDFFKHHMSLSLQQQHGHSDHAVGFAAIAMHLPLPHSVLALDFAGAVAEEVLHHTAAEHLPARSVTAETPQHDVLEGSPSPIMSASLPNLLQAPASLAATSFEALRVAEGDEHHMMSDEHLFKTSFDGCVADEGRSSSTTTSGGAGCVAARALRSSRDIPQ